MNNQHPILRESLYTFNFMSSGRDLSLNFILCPIRSDNATVTQIRDVCAYMHIFTDTATGFINF